jgi:hypothetical protein
MLNPKLQHPLFFRNNRLCKQVLGGFSRVNDFAHLVFAPRIEKSAVYGRGTPARYANHIRAPHAEQTGCTSGPSAMASSRSIRASLLGTRTPTQRMATVHAKSFYRFGHP